MFCRAAEYLSRFRFEEYRLALALSSSENDWNELKERFERRHDTLLPSPCQREPVRIVWRRRIDLFLCRSLPCSAPLNDYIDLSIIHHFIQYSGQHTANSPPWPLYSVRRVGVDPGQTCRLLDEWSSRELLGGGTWMRQTACIGVTHCSWF